MEKEIEYYWLTCNKCGSLVKTYMVYPYHLRVCRKCGGVMDADAEISPEELKALDRAKAKVVGIIFQWEAHTSEVELLEETREEE